MVVALTSTAPPLARAALRSRAAAQILTATTGKFHHQILFDIYSVHAVAFQCFLHLVVLFHMANIENHPQRNRCGLQAMLCR